MLSSPLILSLRQQRAEVKRRAAELATRYGPKHPVMMGLLEQVWTDATGDEVEVAAECAEEVLAELVGDTAAALKSLIVGRRMRQE